MSAEAVPSSASPRHRSAWASIKVSYFRTMVALILMIAFASFFRERDQLLSNISFWLFLVPFVASVWRLDFGFLAALLLVTVTPAVHEQFNVLAGVRLHAWAYPGVDCFLGFLAAWVIRGGPRTCNGLLEVFPSGPLLLFHAWMVLSAVIAVGRNIWQSASELSLRGLAYNVWLTRGISWHDDYYPLQDPYFYGVALAMLFATWGLLSQDGDRLLKRMVGVVLAGAIANVLFALWQKATGMGWVNGDWSINANAFWPDLHSFGVFMAATLLLGCGVLWSGRSTPLIWGSVLAAAIGLYLSGSRSTFLLVLASLIAWSLIVSLRGRGWRRGMPILVFVALAIAAHLILAHGYRGMSYDLISEQFRGLNLDSLNIALSHRPEIWVAALRMYLSFPFFGLGQAAFYRQSAIPEFSGSEFLAGMNGEGVHNEFLRVLVELGPVGLGLALFASIPSISLGRVNLKLVSFYPLAGLALGSFYTNAMLVRELLVLCAVFGGSYLWEAQTVGGASWRTPAPSTVRYVTATLLVAMLAALIEVATSFARFPFRYGQRCLEIHPLTEDGWTRGASRIAVPPAAAGVELIVTADRPDLLRRSLDLDLSVLSGSGTVLWTQRRVFRGHGGESAKFSVVLPDSIDGRRFLELKPSHCYVPLNLGVTYDPRRLGVRVRELRFRTAAGAETH